MTSSGRSASSRSRSSFSFISFKPGCRKGKVAFKDIFDLKATAIEQRETDDIYNEEDSVLKEVVKLFKGANIGFLRVVSGSKNEKFVGLDELFQADCFFKRNRFIENIAVNWQGASVLTDLRECARVIRQRPSRGINPGICQVGGQASIGVAKTQEADVGSFTLR